MLCKIFCEDLSSQVGYQCHTLFHTNQNISILQTEIENRQILASVKQSAARDIHMYLKQPLCQFEEA